MAARAGTLRIAAAVLVLLVGVVHYQQYLDGLSGVKTIGVLFLLNAAGAAAATVMLLWSDVKLRLLGALTGAAISIGSLVSILLARGGGIFGYQEPDWRAAVVFAVVVEIVALPVLAAMVAAERGEGAGAGAPAGSG